MKIKGGHSIPPFETLFEFPSSNAQCIMKIKGDQCKHFKITITLGTYNGNVSKVSGVTAGNCRGERNKQSDTLIVCSDLAINILFS